VATTTYAPKPEEQRQLSEAEEQQDMNHDALQAIVSDQHGFHSGLKVVVHTFEELLGHRLAWVPATEPLQELFKAFYVASRFPVRQDLKCNSSSTFGNIATSVVTYYINQIRSLQVSIVLNDNVPSLTLFPSPCSTNPMRSNLAILLQGISFFVSE